MRSEGRTGKQKTKQSHDPQEAKTSDSEKVGGKVELESRDKARTLWCRRKSVLSNMDP